jgi:uncharacterized protein (DUF2147 family)
MLNTKKDLCKNCSGEDANKPILGLTIIKGLSKDKEYNSGEIMDPKNGGIINVLSFCNPKINLKFEDI